MPKVPMKMHSDLSFTALCMAMFEFRDAFNFLPSILEVGVDNIFVGMDIREVKSQFALKDFWFTCDKDFPKYYWQVSGIKDGEKYSIYSEGA